MIIWADRMYYDRHVKRRKRKIMRTIQRGKIMPGIYCITLSSNPANLLDIVRLDCLRHSYKENESIYVLGLAFTKTSAVDMVMQMVDEVYRKTGDVKLREYYHDRWETC